MKSHKGAVLIIAAVFMEMSWLYACASFTSRAVLARSFPLGEAALAFALGFLVARLTSGKGSRVATILGLHVFGIACVALRTMYTIYFPGYSFLSSAWLEALIGGQRGFLEWVGLVVVLLWASIFWIGGVTLMRRPKTYFAFCSRLDIGLAAFFCLFLARMLLTVKGGTEVDSTAPLFSVIFFVVCSLFAIGMARMQAGGLKSFLPGYRAAAVILSFVSGVVILSAGLVVLSMSRLSAAAESVHNAVGKAAVFSLPLVERVLRVIFSRGGDGPEASAPAPKGIEWDGAAWGKGTWWMDYIEKVLSWGLWSVLGVVLVGLLCFAVVFMVRWLLSKTAVRPEAAKDRTSILQLLRGLLRALLLWGRRMSYLVKGYHRAGEIYAALLRWAHLNGLEPYTAETPSEFGARLGRYFPRLDAEINVIVDNYNKETYGEIALTDDLLSRIRRAGRTLRNPLYWPVRFKVRFWGERTKG